jgi:uncharacterized RDD family membrane protein YckC
MRNILEILTPENVFVEYEIAGLGSRFAAFLIDTLIQVGIYVIIFLCLIFGMPNVLNSLSTIDIAAFSSAIVIIFMIIYFTFFEVLMNGQTPGKKVMKLRVLKQTGEPISFFDSFLRNLLRLADLLPPTTYLLGALLILFSKQNKRVGDYAANTIVTRIKKEAKPVTLSYLFKNINRQNEEEDTITNIYPVNNSEYSILKEYISRAGTLGEREMVFIYHLNRYFSKKFGFDKPVDKPYEFFKEIVNMNSGI